MLFTINTCINNIYLSVFVNIAHCSTKRQMVHKIFNGYFLFAVIPQKRGKARNQEPNVTMQNLNPSDSLNYTYVAVKTRSAARKFFTVTLTITQEKY